MPNKSQVTWHPLDSSNIYRIAYVKEPQGQHGELWVRFKSNPHTVYCYEAVSSGVMADFLHASSPGTFFIKQIRDRYKFTKKQFEEEESE